MLKSSKIIFPKSLAVSSSHRRKFSVLFYFPSQLATQDTGGNAVLQIITELPILWGKLKSWLQNLSV